MQCQRATRNDGTTHSARRAPREHARAHENMRAHGESIPSGKRCQATNMIKSRSVYLRLLLAKGVSTGAGQAHRILYNTPGGLPPGLARLTGFGLFQCHHLSNVTIVSLPGGELCAPSTGYAFSARVAAFNPGLECKRETRLSVPGLPRSTRVLSAYGRRGSWTRGEREEVRKCPGMKWCWRGPWLGWNLGVGVHWRSQYTTKIHIKITVI